MATSTTPQFVTTLAAKRQLLATPVCVAHAALRIAAEQFFSQLAQVSVANADLAIVAYHATELLPVGGVIDTVAGVRLVGVLVAGRDIVAPDANNDSANVYISFPTTGFTAFYNTLGEDWQHSAFYQRPISRSTSIETQVYFSGAATGTVDVALILARG